METEWFFFRGGDQIGPVSAVELKRLAATGQLAPSDQVWKEGMEQWVKAERLKGLFPVSTVAPTPKPLPPPVPATSPLAIAKPGTIHLFRTPKLTGFLHSIRVEVDGQLCGEIDGSISDLFQSQKKSLSLTVPAGPHTLTLNGGGLKRTVEFVVPHQGDLRYEVFFSNLGVLGGGINCVPLHDDVSVAGGRLSEGSPTGQHSETGKGVSSEGDSPRVNPLVIGISLLFCFPVGLYFVWSHPTWKKPKKLAWTGAWIFLMLIGLANSDAEKRGPAALPAAAPASEAPKLQGNRMLILGKTCD